MYSVLLTVQRFWCKVFLSFKSLPRLMNSDQAAGYTPGGSDSCRDQRLFFSPKHYDRLRDPASPLLKGTGTCLHDHGAIPLSSLKNWNCTSNSPQPFTALYVIKESYIFYLTLQIMNVLFLKRSQQIRAESVGWISFGALPCREKILDNSSRLDVVEIARVAWHVSFQPL